jgi:hypothetical protein
MEPCTESVNLALDLDRQNQVPLHGCRPPPPEAGWHFSITLQKIIDWPMSLEGLASYVVKQ